MSCVVSGNQSSSIASTKPTLLNRREDSVRRKNQRSSSWPGWIPPPLLGQPDNKVFPARSSSLGRGASPDIAQTSRQEEQAEKRGGFRKWGKRKDKKSVTFEEDVGVNLQDCDSASGTVRRQKLSTVGSVSGIFSRTTRDEEQNRAPDPVSRLDFANGSRPVPGSWVEQHAPGQEGTHYEGGNREYWSTLRRQIEETAKLQDERHKRQATKSGKKEKHNHQRTVSRDDQLIARGANPRTGVVSPSIMSGGSSSGSRDSQEENATLQKWRLKGNEWISLSKNEKSPFPSPSENEIPQPEFPGLQRSKTESVGLNASVPPTECAPNPINPEDKFVVHMPSAREPSPLTMTAQQIVDFQKTLERVHHEGEQMLDPDTLPTPRSVTPTGISTPPRRLKKNIKEKILGRKRAPKSPSPPLAVIEPPTQGHGHSAIISPNEPVPDIKVTSCPDNPEDGKLCNNEETCQGQPASHAHARGVNGGPFLGQSRGHGEKCTQISWPRTASCPHCLSPQSMNSRNILTQKETSQEYLISRTAGKEELTERSPLYYPLTMAQILHGDRNLSVAFRKNPGGPMKGASRVEDPVLNCGQQHKLTEQENLSTIITTMTPTSTGTGTASMTPPLTINQRPLNHDINPDVNANANSSPIPGKTNLCHSGTCCSLQQCHYLSETSANRVLTLDGRVEQNVNRGVREIPLNLSRNMHGSTHISEGLNQSSNLPDGYCASYIQNRHFNPARKIPSAQGSIVTIGSGLPPMYNTIPLMNNGAVSQDDVVKRAVKSDSGSVIPISQYFLPNIQTGNGRDLGDQENDNLLDNQTDSTSVVQFLHYIVRGRHTINFLRLIAIQFFTMALHCLRFLFSFCDCCHKFSKTGVLPRAPRNFNDAGILLLDTGQAFIYFAVMVVACTFLTRGLVFLATVASWLVWALKPLALV
ncbi:hypothetical protein GX51_05535 [Blastomyces parvus]|uniref:Uncharacterized protein n=1 Tax=Blastomyces parvus TaxID=2060905 RepID=A0A2B7WWK2_9EURO|nr:hypothetical protein GX51_05535 [Blastomyces parvus]